MQLTIQDWLDAGYKRYNSPVYKSADDSEEFEGDLAAAIDVDLLPPLLQDFERLIGLPATLDLVRAYGGLRIYIPTPARVRPDHPIARLIGVERLAALAEVYGAEDHFPLPKTHHGPESAHFARFLHSDRPFRAKAIVNAQTSQIARKPAPALALPELIHSPPVRQTEQSPTVYE